MTIDEAERSANGNAEGLTVSFEFFPPKSDEQLPGLEKAAERLARFRPKFVSMTYGAGGSTRDRSFQAVRLIIEGTSLPTAAHLTCVGQSRQQVADVVARFRDLGVSHFVALRGDPEGGFSEPYRPHPEGFQETADLVAFLKEVPGTEVSVSAYPERHPQSADWAEDLDVLKRKIDAGADRAITQLFFGNDLFEAFLERARAAGITIPIVPGILPIHKFSAVQGFAGRCGASIPERLARRFEGLETDMDTHRRTAVEVAAEQVIGLRKLGVDFFHFYTLNKGELVEATLESLGLRAAEKQAA